MTNTKKITVDVVSDIACPWCYIGKRRLETALKQWDGANVDVRWHPFQLDPNMTQKGMNRDTYLTNKFGSLNRIKDSIDNLIEAGNKEGINFDFGEDWLAVNTLHLHQLLEVAGKEGFKTELKERLFKGYFEETEHLNDLNVLYDILAPFGWDKIKVRTIIEDNAVADKVKKEISGFQKIGITGVPYFIINKTYGISGAQPAGVFLDAFNQVTSIDNMDNEATCDLKDGKC